MKNGVGVVLALFVLVTFMYAVVVFPIFRSADFSKLPISILSDSSQQKNSELVAEPDITLPSKEDWMTVSYPDYNFSFKFPEIVHFNGESWKHGEEVVIGILQDKREVDQEDAEEVYRIYISSKGVDKELLPNVMARQAVNRPIDNTSFDKAFYVTAIVDEGPCANSVYEKGVLQKNDLIIAVEKNCKIPRPSLKLTELLQTFEYAQTEATLSAVQSK